MPAPLVPDEKFVQICRSSKTCLEIANKIGGCEREVRRRMTRLEPVYGPLHPSKSKLRIPRDSLSIAFKRPYTAIVFSDCHYWPGHITAAHQILLKIAKDIQPKVIIGNGDLLDGYSISTHPKIMWEEGPSLADEIETIQLRLGEIQEASPKSKLIRTIGNHCLRYETYLAKHAPQYKDIHGASLEDHIPNWDTAWAVVLNDHTVVKHRLKGGTGAAYNNAKTAGTNIVTGHTHRLTARTVSNYVGEHVGIEGGTLSDPVEGGQYVYTESNPLDWQSGFVVLHIDGDELHHELVHVKNGQAWYGGKKYKG